MDVTLRPLSLGEILDRTFQLYRSHFLMFAGISSFAAGLDLVWKLVQTTAIRSVQHRVGAVALGAVSSGFTLINLLIYVVVSAVAMAAITRAVSAIYLGQTTGIAQAYREVRAHWFRYVCLYIVAALLAWGPVMLIFIAVITVAIAVPGFASGTFGVLVLPALLGLGTLVLFPFGVWMSLRYSLANPACVFEDLGIRAALKRSIFLSKGAMQKLNIFVMLFLVVIISSILTYAGLMPLLISVFRDASNHVTPVLSLGMTVYSLLIQFIVAAVTIPLYAIGLTLFYYDTRIRKEGFDVEWLMQRAAGDSVPPPLDVPSPAESAGQA